MARKLEGSKYKSRDVWYATITVARGKRESFALPTCTTDEQAEARKNIVNDVVQRLRGAGHAALVPRWAKEAAERPTGKALDRIVNAVTALCCGKMVVRDLMLETATFREVGESWTSGKMAEEYRGQVTTRQGADEIAALLEKHVYPLVGEVPIGMFGPEHAQLVLNHYPQGNDPGSARNIAKLVNRVLSLAVHPLKLLAVHPLRSGSMPKAGPPKSRSCLQPAEDAQLMACRAVEIGLRVLWGYLHREGHRKGEAFLLVFRHFDLKQGTVNLVWNKTMDPRFWVLSPGVAAMLQAWKRYREEVLGETITGDTPVFFACDGRPLDGRTFHAARVYRNNLETAGIDRAQLFANSGNSRQVRAHDTRAAFVTVALASGKNEIWVSDRTGHCSMAEMKTYRRHARTFAELKLGDWTPLDQLIPELLPYMGEASPKEEPLAPSPEPATSTPASVAPVAAAAPSRRKGRRAAVEALPVPVAEAEPRLVAAAMAEAPATLVEGSPLPLVASAVEAPAAVVEASLLPLVAAGADAAPVCNEVEGPHGEGLAAAAPDCMVGESGWAPHRGARRAIVGASVGVSGGLGLGAGFVSVENQHESPWIGGVQFLPTFGGELSSSGTGP